MLIVEEIWDSIAADHELMGVTEAQKKELDRRIALHNAAPCQGKSWEEIRDRLKAAKDIESFWAAVTELYFFDGEISIDIVEPDSCPDAVWNVVESEGVDV